MKILFWVLTALIFYCYFGYPLVLFLLAKIIPRRVRKSEYTPTVSVVVSACDEEDVIEGKVRNLLFLDYPQDKIEILIGSDGSTDRTNEIIKGFKNPRIRLIENTDRQGKVATLNRLVQHAKNDIIVFTDARQVFAKDAVHELVKNFADPTIGCVSGELIFEKEQGATAKGINLYWNYEKFIRLNESRIHSMIGATGAIYAIRRQLYTPAPANTVLDDVFIPLAIVRKGYRAIFDDSAKAYDEAANSPREEHRRKARTLYGNYQIFAMFPGAFNPFKSPIALQIFSHKLLRLFVPFFLIAIFVLNGQWLDENLYEALFAAQVLFYIMAMTGVLARHQKYGILGFIAKLCYVPYVFCLLNFSALAGFVRFAFGNQQVKWEKARK